MVALCWKMLRPLQVRVGGTQYPQCKAGETQRRWCSRAPRPHCSAGLAQPPTLGYAEDRTHSAPLPSATLEVSLLPRS